jgi:hypothetical protein
LRLRKAQRAPKVTKPRYPVLSLSSDFHSGGDRPTALLGSKLLSGLENPARSASAPLVAVLSSKTIVGGLIGGLIAVEIVKKIAGIRTPTGDLFAIPLCVGIAVGRIGCFLTGLDDGTFAVATTLPWGINFGDGIARHPTQLYEIVCLLVSPGSGPLADGAARPAGRPVSAAAFMRGFQDREADGLEFDRIQ